MDQRESRKPAGPEPEPRRLPYEPPRILSREPLEMVAGVCSPGKAVEGAPGCELTQNS